MSLVIASELATGDTMRVSMRSDKVGDCVPLAVGEGELVYLYLGGNLDLTLTTSEAAALSKELLNALALTAPETLAKLQEMAEVYGWDD